MTEGRGTRLQYRGPSVAEDPAPSGGGTPCRETLDPALTQLAFSSLSTSMLALLAELALL